jgi:hypothetical protein
MNILLVGLHYHDYTNQIVSELRILGHTVSVHDLQPRNFLMKAMRVSTPNYWQYLLDIHHKNIIESERGNEYQVVIFIQAHQVSCQNLIEFKRNFEQANFILYNWDALNNLRNLENLELFDSVATFDPADARDYGLMHLPLFCVRDFQTLAKREQDRRGVYFVGNIVNPARYDAIAAFRDYCARHSIRLQAHLACTPVVQARLVQQGRLPRGLSRGAIAKDRFIDMVETSSAVFDFANHRQTGYTMRVIENLCAGKKIITNNPRIAFESFYSPDRIHVFKDLDFTGIAEFLAIPLTEPDEVFADFHLQNFLVRLLEGRGHPLPPEEALRAMEA